MDKWYQLSSDEIFSRLGTSEAGLDKTHIATQQEKFGKNVLKEVKQRSKFQILLKQFKDVMILILILAAAVSFVVGERTDTYVILAIIVANAWIGFAQENNAEEAVRMLQKMAAQFAMVVRSGDPGKVEASELVPGDLILLEAGDIVPADARLLEIRSFKTEEAALTGESHGVDKITEVIHESVSGPGDQRNMIFKGTMVSNGSAKAIVTNTGMDTEIGKIADLLSTGSQRTPLQKRLAVFSRQLALIVIIICLIVFGFGLARGEAPYLMFLTALSLAVAALPEALPAVITIALSNGARRMAKQKALMRNLPAVETLGSVTYICSDKTGTLTQNVMTVEKTKATEDNEELLLNAMMLANEVRFAEDDKLLGDSTETALVKYAIEKGLSKTEADKSFPLDAKNPFDSERMRMSTLHEYNGKWILFTKGAPATIADVLSDRYKTEIESWLDKNREWASEGLRVLFFAHKIFDHKPKDIDETLEAELDLTGMVAMIDPPREEVIEAIRECKEAGIKPVMITGDQPRTAVAIARRLDIIDEDPDNSITGADLSKLNEADLDSATRRIAVYARVSPGQKLSIVKSLQHNGQFVAMTGDGVNDAPSLKQADIGIAMGITGTDVSKQSADMILLDDNFATIVKAVKEGRRIYENIRKFILYVLSCNLAEVLTIFFAPIIGLAIPLLPIHILWINLVTDGLPGLALTSEPAEKDIMKRAPRPPGENLFAGGLITRIGCSGLLMAIAVLIVQTIADNQGYDVNAQQTIVFTLLCFAQLGNALSVRFSYSPAFSRTVFDNKGMWGVILLTIGLQLMIVYVPFLQSIFNTESLNSKSMQMILWATLVCVTGFELIKYFTNRKSLQKS